MTSEFPLEKLGKFVSVKSGFPFSSNDMGDVGAPIIKIGNITPPKIDINNVQRISFKKISEDPRIQKFALEKGDILIALTGATVGKMGRMPQTKEVFYLNQRVGKIFFHNQIQIDRDFIYYALSQENNIEMMFGFADGSAQANLSGAQIESIEIPFPPISEQTKIAGILGALDKQIELNNLMNATLESIASVVFKSWFVDFDPVGAKIKANLPSKMAIEIAATFPSGFQSSDHGEIPEGWASLKWGDIAILEYGKALIGYKFANAPYKVYGTNGAIGWHTEALCLSEGIIIGRKGAYRGIHYSPDPFFVIDTAFYLHPVKKFSMKWAYYELLRVDINGMDSGSAIPSTSRTDFYNIPVIFPSEDVLNAFEIVIAPIFSMIYANNKESRTLASLRDALLPKLMRGEVRVKG